MTDEATSRAASRRPADVKSADKKRGLLKGICPKAVALLEGRRLSARVFTVLRKMKAARQIEAVQHMIAANNFAVSFLKSILLITKSEMLASARSHTGKRPPLQSFLEQEHERLLRSLKTVESSLGIDMLTLAISLKYAERMLFNNQAKSYLETHHFEALALLVDLVEKNRSAIGDHAA